MASLAGHIPDDQRQELEQVLASAGYKRVLQRDELVDDDHVFRYQYIKASGMLKLTADPSGGSAEVPRYIAVQRGMENVLVANGWSFLDPDESEPISAFDVDAANREGQYKPRWGVGGESGDESVPILSSLGYSLQRPSYDSIVEASEGAGVTPQAKKVLLGGGTDPSYVKLTNNGFDFSAGALQSNTFPDGIFVCAIGSLPLFTTADLKPPVLLASDGWLSFRQPVSDDHIKLIYPDKLDLDQRIEVVDAKTGCHLGHYFGKRDGYCINASALNFVPLGNAVGNSKETDHEIGPFSWRSFLGDAPEKSPSREILSNVVTSKVEKEEIILGAGCFWHVEFALRRLPGVIETETGYAGGQTLHPTYKDLCSGGTGHAEVVRVCFDPAICDANKLIDCWLAMHDPTMVRAHGKRAIKTGQYRSCAFALSEHMLSTLNDVVNACREQLEKEISSEIKLLARNDFWAAEDRHQRHDERRKGGDLSTLSFEQWLLRYGRRSASILGSSETILVEDDLDDGMARLMI